MKKTVSKKSTFKQPSALPGEVFYGLCLPNDSIINKYPELIGITSVRFAPSNQGLTYYHLYVNRLDLENRVVLATNRANGMQSILDRDDAEKARAAKNKKTVKPSLVHLPPLVLNDVKVAYADLNPNMDWDKAVKLRKLDFTASEFVSRDEAIVIFKAAGVTSYNEFNPNLLKHFPESAKIRIERNASVQITVECDVTELPPIKKVKADTVRATPGKNQFVYWWD